MRQAEIKRKTQETDIELAVNLDQQEPVAIETGVGFFDHMLTLFARHSRISLTVKAEGDLWVDSHHTIEDVGIVLGQALRQALGDKAGINRYGTSFVPMDETLGMASLDLSGRSYLVFEADFDNPKLGNFDTELVEEFFQALAFNLQMKDVYKRQFMNSCSVFLWIAVLAWLYFVLPWLRFRLMTQSKSRFSCLRLHLSLRRIWDAS